MSNNIKPIISNRRLAPYRLESFDKLQVKLVLNIKDKLSFLKNIPVELWLNYTGNFIKCVDGLTNSQGIVDLSYSCEFISDITECLGYAKAIINNVEYFSNITRFNFILGVSKVTPLIIYSNELILYNDDLILYEV